MDETAPCSGQLPYQEKDTVILTGWEQHPDPAIGWVRLTQDFTDCGCPDGTRRESTTITMATNTIASSARSYYQ